MAVEQFANLAATTLTSGINNVTTTLPVVSGAAPFPQVAQFRIVVDSEIMLVTAGAGTASWTVTRGAENTTAVAHSNGSAVTHVLTAAAVRGIQYASEVVVNPLDPAYGAVNDDSATTGQAIQNALDSFATGGTAIGGRVALPAGDYSVERPLIIPSTVRLSGSNSQSGTIVRAASTFPHMTISGGSFALPQATITVTSMSANMPTTGGVFTVISNSDPTLQIVFYTGVSGNTFTGCTGGTGTVANGAVVGTFQVWLGDPIAATGGTYGNRLENIEFDASPTGASANAIPGSSFVFSNRCQEDAGGYSIKGRNFMHFGAALINTTAVSGQKAQDFWFDGLTLSPASTCTADTISYYCDGAASSYRGVQNVTLASVTVADVPATGFVLRGCSGLYSAMNIERHKVAFRLMGTGATNSNAGVVIQAIYAYGGGTTNMTDVVKIESSHVGAVTLAGIRKVSAPSCNLVNHNDGTNTYTLTDNSIALYAVGEENGSAARTIITDGGIASRFMNGATFAGTVTLPTGAVTSGMILDGTIVDADVNGSAAIAATKISGTALIASNNLSDVTAATARTNLGLGSLATKSTVASADITDGTIVDADINGSAAIAATKISGTAVTAADTGTVTSTMILNGTILDADVNASAAIALSKLAGGTFGQRPVSAGSTLKYAPRIGASLLPQSMYASTFDRAAAAVTNIASAITTQVVRAVAIELTEGDVVSNIVWYSGATPLSAGTHQWAALADQNRVQLATSADKTSTAWAANSPQVFAVATIASGASSTFTCTYTGLYYLLLDVAGTVPTLAGQPNGAAYASGAAGWTPIISGTGETLNTAAPAFAKTYTAFTNVAGIPYAGVS